MKFGVTLSNRGVLVGLCTTRDLLKLADAVEASPLMDSVWCGDALFVNRRLDALTLLAAVAGRTERVLLGPACMGSFGLRDPMVFAYEWASLDVISNGRTRLVACAGGGAGPLWEAETAAMGINPEDRRKHMVENMHVLRHLWTKDNAPFEGQFVKFSNITLEPKPVQNPCPIWLATNAERLSTGQADSGGSEFALTRVGKIADGWMTHSVSPEGFRRSWDFILKVGGDQGRDMSGFDHVLYHHINVNDDREAALADSKTFLDLYYTANYSKERLEAWLTYGTPRDCIEHLRRYKAAGCKRVTFRISTMGNPLAQLKRVTEEVLPFV
jgi:alkanesulfonate monooxygenase SsuD/methylene tetrahydromethanopterin reductase-like flavin-dependent oxidoreductase (luciferase family)